jgi:hypothetical protein
MKKNFLSSCYSGVFVDYNVNDLNVDEHYIGVEKFSVIDL